MNRLLSTLAALVLMTSAHAQTRDYSKYYQNLPTKVAQVSAPMIPANEVSLTEVGGVGDGVTLNTEAFENGIKKLQKVGGGRLTVPQGIWLTGPIQLKDNIELHLEKNAIILLSPDKSLFVNDKSASRVFAGIRASKRKNIAITGEGIIDGNGDHWRPVKRQKVSDVEWNKYKKVIGGVEKDGGKLWYPWNDLGGYPNIADTPEKQEKSAQRPGTLRELRERAHRGCHHPERPQVPPAPLLLQERHRGRCHRALSVERPERRRH